MHMCAVLVPVVTFSSSLLRLRLSCSRLICDPVLRSFLSSLGGGAD